MTRTHCPECGRRIYVPIDDDEERCAGCVRAEERKVSSSSAVPDGFWSRPKYDSAICPEGHVISPASAADALSCQVCNGGTSGADQSEWAVENLTRPDRAIAEPSPDGHNPRESGSCSDLTADATKRTGREG